MLWLEAMDGHSTKMLRVRDLNNITGLFFGAIWQSRGNRKLHFSQIDAKNHLIREEMIP